MGIGTHRCYARRRLLCGDRLCLVRSVSSAEAISSLEPAVSRTVLGICLLLMAYNISYYCWAIYFSEYLHVIYKRSLSDSGTILNIFSLVNAAWLLVVGYGIRRTRRYRWVLWWAVPLEILFEGLLIYSRGQGTNIGCIVMCMVFMAIAGGVFILVGQVAVLAAASHQGAASALATLNVFGTIGSAIGSSISGAIWTAKFPGYLQKYNVCPRRPLGRHLR